MSDGRGGEASGGTSGRGSAGEPTIEVLRDPDGVAHAAAERIAAAIGAADAARGRVDWATTGGSSPVGIYAELAAPPHRDGVPWDHVHVWWGDDRFVPRDHPLSNVLPFDQVLIRAAAHAGQSGEGDDGIDVTAGREAGVPIPVANVHAMPIQAAIGAGRDAAAVASEYERELRTAPLALSDAGFPSFDIVLVGMGADGHVLSVFPGSTAFESGAWVAAVPAPTHIEPHVARVSLHPGFLAAARLVLVVAFGAAKAEILANVLGDERDPDRWPIQHARTSNAIWLLDEAAAAQLPR
jgi:6-phosphogluconolactonase